MTTSALSSFDEPLRAALLAPGGQEFIEWLLRDVCGCFRSPMGAEGDIQYLCGKQDVGYALAPIVGRVSPATLIKLMENL